MITAAEPGGMKATAVKAPRSRVIHWQWDVCGIKSTLCNLYADGTDYYAVQSNNAIPTCKKCKPIAERYLLKIIYI